MNKDYRISLKQRFLLVALIACTSAFLANAVMAQSTPISEESELVYSDRPVTWIMGQFAGLRVSSDGNWAALGGGGLLRLIDLSTGQDNPAKLAGSLKNVSALTFPGGEEFARRGTKGDQAGWYFSSSAEGLPPVFPPSAVPSWSPNRYRARRKYRQIGRAHV